MCITMESGPLTLQIADFDYTLPEDRIAAQPLPNREDSKLLVYRHGSLSDSHYRNIAEQLPVDGLMFFNNTRVIGARILFSKPTGGVIEIFLLQPADRSLALEQALQQHSPVEWKCLIGGASKWKAGMILSRPTDPDKPDALLYARYVGKNEEDFTIELSWTAENLTLYEVLQSGGNIPLPPYIKRKADATDSLRYQTTFSSIPGSVAAPTAGLHFTPDIINSIRARGIQVNFLTLHVGAGTFKPVKSERIGQHEMHAEQFSIQRSQLETLLRHPGQPVIAVGTTTLRTLESLYWIGNLLHQHPELSAAELEISQWHPYTQQEEITVHTALENILEWMNRRNADTLTTSTRIMIAPGYSFKLVDILVTNFHQPKSTLLLLVSAFTGNNWHNVYDHALKNDYRFLSYGDGCLLFRH